MTFHPKSMSWSYLGRGMAALNKMKKLMTKITLTLNQTNGGTQSPKILGPIHPPKKSVTIIQEIRASPRYSPNMNMANFIPPYSVWKPAVSSCSASGRSKGSLWLSAMPAITKTNRPRIWEKQNQTSSWASTISTRLKLPVIMTTPMRDKPMNTS